jgi:NodT family efflux transporter outer membrane factor (OMF) lipoprotein
LQKPAFVREFGTTFDPTPPPSRWWESVADPTLTQLIDDALSANPTLEVAEARVRGARAQIMVQQSKYLPTGGANAGYVRARIPIGSLSPSNAGNGTNSLPNPLAIDVYNATFDASWEMDLFGATRRGIEGARATADGAQAAFEDVQVQLAAQVAQSYVNLRAAQTHLRLAEQTVGLRSKAVALTRQRVDQGTAAQVDLDRELADLSEARAGVPADRAQVDLELDQLAMLTAREPGSLDAMLDGDESTKASVPSPPGTSVPVGTPAEWLRRRPDIRGAERTLAARNAAIAQNVAAYFPNVSLLGLVGATANVPSGLGLGTPLSVVAPTLSWSFLDIPRKRANVHSAEADRDQAVADYRRSVLQALQDANSSLERFGRLEQAVQDWRDARDSAAHAAQLTEERYAAGTAALIDSLDTERQRTAAEDQLVSAQADLMNAYVSLQKSLGLGWGTPAPPFAKNSVNRSNP